MIYQELDHDVHFYIGKYSTQDEYGTAAYKTVELDTYVRINKCLLIVLCLNFSLPRYRGIESSCIEKNHWDPRFAGLTSQEKFIF